LATAFAFSKYAVITHLEFENLYHFKKRALRTIMQDNYAGTTGIARSLQKYRDCAVNNALVAWVMEFCRDRGIGRLCMEEWEIVRLLMVLKRVTGFGS
jgi:hypothetical protein